MRIITISRQFGSGGRELGKRLSDLLDWDYYDREIIDMLAQKRGTDPEYVRRMLASRELHHYQPSFRHSFQQHTGAAWHRTEMLVGQREVIQEIAKLGKDCIIVGRDADVILREEHPFRLYICAEMSSRIARCMRFEEKKDPKERLSEKEIARNIRRIDRERRQTREILTGNSVRDGSSFDLTVNATNWDIKKLAEAVAEFSGHVFAQ